MNHIARNYRTHVFGGHLRAVRYATRIARQAGLCALAAAASQCVAQLAVT